MSETAVVVGLAVNLAVLIVNVGAGFYWAGSVRATLGAMDRRLGTVETELRVLRQRIERPSP